MAASSPRAAHRRSGATSRAASRGRPDLAPAPSGPLVVVDAPPAPVADVATAEAGTREILADRVHADRERGGDDELGARVDGQTDRQRLADRPRGAHEQEAQELTLFPRHERRPCRNEASFAHSPSCARSSWSTQPERTASLSSSRRFVWSISGPSVLKEKRTLCFRKVAMYCPSWSGPLTTCVCRFDEG